MIISYRGNQRSGKTFRMTLDAIKYSVQHDCPIYSNYPIHVGDVYRFTRLSDLYHLRNVIIAFDEAHSSLDSRNFKSDKIIAFTHFFSQMGKLGNTFLYNVQRIDTLEKRIRTNTDYIYECTRLLPSHQLRFDVYDARRDAENPIYIRTEFIRNPEKYYGIYDSFAVVSTAE